MWKTVAMKHRLVMMVIMVASLSLLGSLAGLTRARADTPNAMCILQISAGGNVLGTLTDQAVGLNLTVLVPSAENIDVPMPCNSRKTLILAVVNQANHAVTVNTKIFTNRGQLSCTKPPLSLPVQSGGVVTFTDCP